jgi:PKD repeat protein
VSKFSVYWVTCILAILGMVLPASATTIVMPTDAQLVTKSPLIVEGTVVSSAPVERNGGIWTETTINVDRVLKGSAPGTIVVREIGGAIGNRISKIFGTPEYGEGERVMAFLTPTPRGDYQTIDLFVGKFAEARMANGERIWMRDDQNADAALLDHDFRPIVAKNVQRRAGEFESYVQDRVSGKKGTQNYGIENPVLEHELHTDGKTKVSNFTLISEPTVYRWFAFEQGSAARWYSSGTQSGYAGGGLNEIQTAMGVWDNYSQAKINYQYAGAMSGAPKGLQAPNGVNEILFNDPLNEIAGSFNPSTGGVVGQGGFNGVTNGPSWNSPFTADATHPQRTYSTLSIIEGNLTIQDNVTPQAGISSSVLAEIVAHEFGHTLGLGHSSDGSALMYASISPGGASLRADDQVAARWLYPNGTQSNPTPTVPNAPSTLSASSIGATITLRWIDASTDETGFNVYLSTTGAFTRVAQAGPSVTGTTLSGLLPGSYRAYVTAFNAAGESAQSNTANFTVSSTPASTLNAAFTFSPITPAINQPVNFTDLSTGSIARWSWDFGDGTTSTLQNPVKRFTNGGTYTVTFAIADAAGATSRVSHVISVSSGAPVTPTIAASFDWTPGSPRAGDTLSFRDTTSGSPTSWAWSFGDGGTSRSQNPTYVFRTAGTYSVTLVASNSSSSSTTARTITVGDAVAAYRSLISVSAQTNGAGGSVWRTELTLFNAGDAANVQLIFLPTAGGNVQSQSLFLSPKQSLTFSNALLDIFGTSSGSGAIAIEATSAASTPNLKVSSRTFTTGSSGTYGQSVPSVGASDMQQSLAIAGIESDADYRTNVGFVNRSGNALTASLLLRSAEGADLGTMTVNVPANSFQQASLPSYFPGINGSSYARLALFVSTSTPSALTAYASVVDNRTQDPVYIQAEPLPTPIDNTLVIPAVGRAAGANGTFWRSDVTLLNPHNGTIDLTLRYLPGGSDNRFAPARVFSVTPGQSLVLPDVLSAFGYDSGAGALQISWATNGWGPSVTSRTYTSTPAGGTFGQSIDPVQSFGYDSFVPGLRSDSSFRSNAGFVNGGDANLNISVTLLSSSGQALANATLSLKPRSQTQTSLGALFPNVNVSLLGSCTLQTHTNDAPALFMYGSIIDNTSGDPVFFAGE